MEEQDANFVLLVLNASQKTRSVDIQVRIDGKLAVDEPFSNEVSDPLMLSIPPHRVFRFRLAPGPHTLAASTTVGKASVDERFELTPDADKRWALLGYDYWSGSAPQPPPGQFEFHVQDKPIYFE